MRFSSDIYPVPLLPPRENGLVLGRRLGGLPGWLGDRRRRWRPGDRRGEASDVLGHLCLAIADEERYAAIECVDNASAVADDRVVHLSADRVLDVRDADAKGRIGAVEDQADLLGPVAQLLADLQEEA